MKDYLAFVRRLAVERYAGNNVEILPQLKVFKDLLRENRRLPGRNGKADAGRFQISQELRNARIYLIFKKADR